MIFPGVDQLKVTPTWCAGELFRYDGDFDKYIRSHNLAKQEGILFRHLLRLTLLCGEFENVVPQGWTESDWENAMQSLSSRLIESCRAIDSDSTDKAMESAEANADVVQQETPL